MPVSAKEFKSWLDASSISTSPAALSALTGLNRGTLGNQLRRGNVAESTVVAVARAAGIGVLQALTAFDGYRDVLSRPVEPSAAEVLSQVHHADLMAELGQPLQGTRVVIDPLPPRTQKPHSTH